MSLVGFSPAVPRHAVTMIQFGDPGPVLGAGPTSSNTWTPVGIGDRYCPD